MYIIHTGCVNDLHFNEFFSFFKTMVAAFEEKGNRIDPNYSMLIGRK